MFWKCDNEELNNDIKWIIALLTLYSHIIDYKTFTVFSLFSVSDRPWTRPRIWFIWAQMVFHCIDYVVHNMYLCKMLKPKMQKKRYFIWINIHSFELKKPPFFVLLSKQNVLICTLACSNWLWSIGSTARDSRIDHIIESIRVFATFSFWLDIGF